jgi:pilus assembly protein Flp/PilA
MGKAADDLRKVKKGETRMYYWYRYIVDHLKSGVDDEKGQALVEYGLLLALIAVVCITIVTTLGTRIEGVFDDIVDALPGGGGGGGGGGR